MNAIDLCQLEDVKAWLNIGSDGDSAAEDAVLARLITAESERIRKHLNLTTIKAKDVQMTFSGTGMRTITFPDSINSVASLSINGATVQPGAGGYVFSGSQLSLPSARFPVGVSNCAVSFNIGFETVPFDIEQACLELVAFRYRERDRIGHASKTIGGETVSFITSGMPESVKMALRPYARVTTPSAGLR